jgi:hypothetical protein
MASCASCSSTILFGGKHQGSERFCDAKCLQRGSAITLANVPDDVVWQHTHAIHQGSCPQCNGPGPVDLHTSHRVWSAVFMTSTSSRPVVSCGPCGKKRKIQDTVFSLFLGWWGLPWGIINTPVQIFRNLSGLAHKLPADHPSPALSHLVRRNLAHHIS